MRFPFKRDTCKLPAGAAARDFGPTGYHGLVRHTRAVVTVTCGECPPGGTLPEGAPTGGAPTGDTAGGRPRRGTAHDEGGGRICSASLPAPGCDLQLHLATPLCPTPRRQTELSCGGTSCVSRVVGADMRLS